MKIAKCLTFFPILFITALFISGCSNEEAASDQKKPETITYQSEAGEIEVPADPQRVVILGGYAGNVIDLGVNIVGVDQYAKMNPLIEDELKNVPVVSDDDIEQIIELQPDLIIGLSKTKNIDKLQEIAPTVTYTYGKLDYLEQHIEIGKLLNKQKEAEAWVGDYKKRATELGEEVRATIGEDATVTVLENADKQLYLYGNGWGRGTGILYQEMGLKMPKKVQEVTAKDGYFPVSAEVLPEYIGDYLILSKNPDYDSAFMQTDTYKNTPAVQNNRVLELNTREVYSNDPITAEYLLTEFETFFLETQ